MQFSEFQPGQVIEAGPVAIGEAEIIAFARDHDPQWFHTDRAAAARGKFGGVIASGWHICATAMRMVADVALAGSEASASPGVAYIRWPNPVRAGDRLWLKAQVLDVSRSRRRETLGKLRWRWRLVNQHGQEVLDLEVTTLFELGADS
ncbi:MaoC family dehydratase [Pseudorhodoferax sp.]|uniref:MaoC family dehydratase n=1 Tax=Pseudorhodoferax sp. TaxID=1993553 RepID=UPI0039E3AD8D